MYTHTHIKATQRHGQSRPIPSLFLSLSMCFLVSLRVSLLLTRSSLFLRRVATGSLKSSLRLLLGVTAAWTTMLPGSLRECVPRVECVCCPGADRRSPSVLLSVSVSTAPFFSRLMHSFLFCISLCKFRLACSL